MGVSLSRKFCAVRLGYGDRISSSSFSRAVILSQWVPRQYTRPQEGQRQNARCRERTPSGTESFTSFKDALTRISLQREQRESGLTSRSGRAAATSRI